MPQNESQTRKALIDPMLLRAGWNVANPEQVGIEIPVDGYDAQPWNGVTDYILLAPWGEIIAVVEAKKRSRNARDADEQLRHYVTEIAKRQSFAPFGFMSNGLDAHFWEVGSAHPRLVSGFFTLADLERLLFIRQNALPLPDIAIDSKIVDRPYQHEAIRRVAENFAKGGRRALLVMATGTGKTRTTMGLIDLFLRARQAQNILFLADREALVDQALTDGFKAHLPHEPRTRIYTHSIETGQRLYVATEQTMSLCHEQFSPAFFDLIVLDEAHRSIFNRFSTVLDYFDARIIGLTATPADLVERNTFRVFGCEDKAPTFNYPFKEAVAEGKLVDFSLYKAQTGFQRDGIKGVDLSEEEQNALVEAGFDPDEIDFSGSELETKVSNRDTLRRQWLEIMEVLLRDQSGQMLGKTIVFAITKDHAARIRDVFEEMFPHYVDMIQVMVSGTERVHNGSYGDGLISKFKKLDLPRIAVSVDMLDTGVDVPEVVNLVFMKPVRSRIKLWQMIGRGTRPNEACHFPDRLPEGKKTGFLVIDFWDNDFEKVADDRVAEPVPVLVSGWNTRLKIAGALIRNQTSPDFAEVVAGLRALVAQIPTDAFAIKRVWPEIEAAWGVDFWKFLTGDKIAFLKLKVGPLLRYVADVDVQAATFSNKIERLKLARLTQKDAADTLQSVAEDVARLPSFVINDPKLAPLVEKCLNGELHDADLAALSEVSRELAPQMKKRRDKENTFLSLDLKDIIASRGFISLGEGGEQIHVAEYRQRVEARAMSIITHHPVIDAIRRGEKVSNTALVELERALHHELGGDLHLTRGNISKAYGWKVNDFLTFARLLLELDELPGYETVVREAFDTHIQARNYSGDQIRFLRAVQNVFLERRHLETADLYEKPFDMFGMNAIDRLFTPADVEKLIEMTGQLAA